jgi:hypothetical protein
VARDLHDLECGVDGVQAHPIALADTFPWRSRYGIARGVDRYGAAFDQRRDAGDVIRVVVRQQDAGQLEPVRRQVALHRLRLARIDHDRGGRARPAQEPDVVVAERRIGTTSSTGRAPPRCERHGLVQHPWSGWEASSCPGVVSQSPSDPV